MLPSAAADDPRADAPGAQPAAGLTLDSSSGGSDFEAWALDGSAMDGTLDSLTDAASAQSDSEPRERGRGPTPRASAGPVPVVAEPSPLPAVFRC